MKISIVIPAYNEELSIEATVSSALNQNYPNFEVIVIDNNSSDRTAELAQRAGAKVVSESKKGVQWARECGRKEATGDIIANLDADCLPERDWLEKGSKHFSNPKVVAVSGPYNYYDSTLFFRKFSLFFQKNIYSLFNFVMQKIHKGAVSIGGNVFLRADVLDKIGGYNTNIVFYGDDTDTAKRMSTQGKVVFDRKLIVSTSARRLKEEGSLKISIIYIYHFFRIIFSDAR